MEEEDRCLPRRVTGAVEKAFLSSFLLQMQPIFTTVGGDLQIQNRWQWKPGQDLSGNPALCTLEC